MQNLLEKYKQNTEIWNNFLGAGISLLGIIVSIILIFINPSNIIISVAVITCQLIVLIFCLSCYHVIAKSKKAIADSEEQITQNNLLHQQSEMMIADKLALSNKFIEKLAIFEKSINKRINNFLTLICDENDKYFFNLSFIEEELLEEGVDNEQAIIRYQKHLTNEQKNYTEQMYDLYKRFVVRTMEDLVNIISAYLHIKGLDTRITLALKLFDVTYHADIDLKKIRVYTAFRDKQTYEDGKREIGLRHYSIDDNSDFLICLKKESYIRNNINHNAEDYANENFPSSLQHYNCTAVVPVISDYKLDRNFFGYLCCEAINIDPNIELFDKRITDILYSAALTIGMFFDSANASWDYVAETEDQEFLTFLHNKCYKGK